MHQRPAMCQWTMKGRFATWIRSTNISASSLKSAPAVFRTRPRQVASEGGPSHFRERVALGDEPCGDARRYVAHLTRLEDIESDPVELFFFRSCNNPDSHEHHEAEIHVPSA